MISKECFIERMQAIDDFYGEQHVLYDALDPIVDGYFVITLGDKLIDTIVKQTNEELYPQDMDLLSWWLYEDVDKIINVDNKEINVEQLEDLYDFMINAKK